MREPNHQDPKRELSHNNKILLYYISVGGT